MAANEVHLDLAGLKCPLPALMLERTLKRVQAGDIVVAVATDPMAEIDLPFSASRLGAHVLSIVAGHGLVTVRVQKQ